MQVYESVIYRVLLTLEELNFLVYDTFFVIYIYNIRLAIHGIVVL